MKQQLQLTIAQPCHEDWNGMTASERGRHCLSCQKQVIDFSNMSDREIAEFFKKPQEGSVCGRFMVDQLDRELSIPHKRLSWLKYFLSILVPAFLFSRATAQKLMGKTSLVQRDTTRIPIDKEIMTLGMVLPTTIKPVCKDTTIKTTIENVRVSKVRVNVSFVDDEKNPVPAVSVMLAGNGKLLKAGEDGKLTFISASDNLIEFLCTSVGYQPTNYIYPFTLQYSSQVDIHVQLKKQVVALPEAKAGWSIICQREYVTGGATVRVAEPVQADSSSSSKPITAVDPVVRFYPNPVKSGQTLHISVTAIEEGYYKWQLLDVNGRMVQHSDIWIDKDAKLIDMRLPFVTTGTYFAVLVNKKTGVRFTGKLIID